MELLGQKANEIQGNTKTIITQTSVQAANAAQRTHLIKARPVAGLTASWSRAVRPSQPVD